MYFQQSWCTLHQTFGISFISRSRFLHLTAHVSPLTVLPLWLSASLVYLLPFVPILGFVGGIGTPRWRESSGTACATAGHSTDPCFSSHCPPAFLLGLFGTGQGGTWRGHSWSQPPPSAHGTTGAEPQFNGSVITAAFIKPSFTFQLVLEILTVNQQKK